MRRAKSCGVLAAAVVLWPVLVAAQTTPVPTDDAGRSDAWSFSFTADGYVVPDSPSFVSPTLSVDHGWMHLEARYNYEDRSTGSFWFGYNFSVGDRVTLEVTPMIGGVLGTTAGIAPGYQLTLSYRRLSLSDVGEYVFDVRDRSGSFFYAWPQIAYSLVDWLKVGLVAQRTRAYHTAFDVQRGALVSIALRHLEFTSYVFAGHSNAALVLEASLAF